MVLIDEAEASSPRDGATAGSEPTPRNQTKRSLCLVIKHAYVYEKIRNKLAPWIQENEEDGSMTVVMKELAEDLSLHVHLPVPKLQYIEPRPAQMLRFASNLPDELFTNRPLVGADGKPLQIELVNSESGEICTETHSSLKVEILVIRGGFPSNDPKLKTCKALSSRNKATMPLLVQEAATKTARKGFSYKKKFIVKLHNGRAVVRGKITDNSSWVRSKMFKLVARVVKGSYQEKAIKVAVSEAFAVKESKLEGRRKHEIPTPNDPIFRLVNVGKKSEKILENMGITTVREFLKKLESDPDKLKKDVGMQSVKWDSTVEHARKCQVIEEDVNILNVEVTGEGDSVYPNLDIQSENIEVERNNLIPMSTDEQMVLDSNLAPDHMGILHPNTSYNGNDDPTHFADETSEVGESSTIHLNFGRLESQQWRRDFGYLGLDEDPSYFD